MVYVTVAMTAFTALVSLAVDLAHARLVKAQLQCAADAAARYAATGLATGVTAAQNNAVSAAAANTADGTSISVDPHNDVDFGTWSSGTFTVLTGAARSSANAVRVTARRTAASGTPVSLSFGGLIGKTTSDVTASAIALSEPGQPYGLVGLSSATVSNCTVDSYNSAQGSYASTHTNSAYVESNSTVNVSGATLGGNVAYGPSGSFSGSAGNVSGTISKLTTALNYPTPSAGSYATTNSNSNVSGYVSSGSFTLNSGTCNMPAGTYYFTDFKVMGGTLNCTGPATIYVTGNSQIASTVNTYQNLPANFQILGTGAGTYQVTAGGNLYGEIYAPSATVKILAAGTYYGAFVGNTLQIMASATVHEDDSLTFGTSKVTTVQ